MAKLWDSAGRRQFTDLYISDRYMRLHMSKRKLATRRYEDERGAVAAPPHETSFDLTALDEPSFTQALAWASGVHLSSNAHIAAQST